MSARIEAPARGSGNKLSGLSMWKAAEQMREGGGCRESERTGRACYFTNVLERARRRRETAARTGYQCFEARRGPEAARHRAARQAQIQELWSELAIGTLFRGGCSLREDSWPAGGDDKGIAGQGSCGMPRGYWDLRAAAMRRRLQPFPGPVQEGSCRLPCPLRARGSGSVVTSAFAPAGLILALLHGSPGRFCPDACELLHVVQCQECIARCRSLSKLHETNVAAKQ